MWALSCVCTSKVTGLCCGRRPVPASWRIFVTAKFWMTYSWCLWLKKLPTSRARFLGTVWPVLVRYVPVADCSRFCGGNGMHIRMTTSRLNGFSPGDRAASSAMAAWRLLQRVCGGGLQVFAIVASGQAFHCLCAAGVWSEVSVVPAARASFAAASADALRPDPVLRLMCDRRHKKTFIKHFHTARKYASLSPT